jgi:hypothetical protein
MMVRLFAFAVFFGFAIWVVAAFVSFGGARPQQTYRPWPRWWFDDEPGGEPGTMHLVKRSELQALRDAYSSAPIDPARAAASLWQLPRHVPRDERLRARPDERRALRRVPQHRSCRRPRRRRLKPRGASRRRGQLPCSPSAIFAMR